MKHWMLFLTGGLGCLALLSCAPPSYLVKTTHDPATGSNKSRLITGTTLINPDNPILDNSVSLDIERTQSPQSGYTYLVQIAYIDKTWLYIAGGESLIFILDGQEAFRLQGPGSLPYRKTLELGNSARVVERASYALSAAQLKQIAKAKKAAVIILGETSKIRRDFSDEALANYRVFESQFGGK